MLKCLFKFFCFLLYLSLEIILSVGSTYFAFFVTSSLFLVDGAFGLQLFFCDSVIALNGLDVFPGIPSSSSLFWSLCHLGLFALSRGRTGLMLLGDFL